MAVLMVKTFKRYAQSHKVSSLNLIRVVLFNEEMTNQYKAVFKKETVDYRQDDVGFNQEGND